MPVIGEIGKHSRIGYKTYTGKLIWASCPDCGAERWVDTKGFERLCRTCANKNLSLRQRGENSPRWRGGRRKNKGGYVLLRYDPCGPFASMCSSNYILEHRLVIAQYLGRSLLPNEHIHHINGVKQDNRLENLKLVSSQKEHFNAVLEENKQLREQVKKLELKVKKLEAEERE